MQEPPVYSKEWLCGFTAALQYMGAPVPPVCNIEETFTNKDHLLDAIRETIEEDLHIPADSVFRKDRHQEVMFLRSYAWVIYQEISGSTQREVAAAFGNTHDRSTYNNMRKSTQSLMFSHPRYEAMAKTLKNGVMLRYLKAVQEKTTSYIDLGLPSGTLWADENYPGLFPPLRAEGPHFDDIPTLRQAQELLDHCTITYNKARKAFTVTGPNANTVIIPATGFGKNGQLHQEGRCAAIQVMNDDPEDDASLYLLLILDPNLKITRQLKRTKDHSLELSIRPIKNTNRELIQ